MFLSFLSSKSPRRSRRSLRAARGRKLSVKHQRSRCRVQGLVYEKPKGSPAYCRSPKKRSKKSYYYNYRSPKKLAPCKAGKTRYPNKAGKMMCQKSRSKSMKVKHSRKRGKRRSAKSY